jgi:hypothetical protein
MPRPPNTWASALDALETAALEALYQTRLPRGRMATILEISTTEAVRSAAAAGLGDGERTLAIWSVSMGR